jgi:hypothetical protein
MSEFCDKYEAYSMFANEEEFIEHLQDCEYCRKEFERELRLSVLIQSSGERYKSLVRRNRLKRMMCKVACILIIFSSIGLYTGLQIREGQRFAQYVRENTNVSIIAENGLPVDDYGFYDYD